MKTPTKLSKIKFYPYNHLFTILYIQIYFSFNKKLKVFSHNYPTNVLLFHSTELHKTK
jgi:hypothetical protein